MLFFGLLQQSSNGVKSNGQSVISTTNKLPKPLLPLLHPVQRSTSEIGGHTPFTPITPCAGGLDGSPTPRPAVCTGSPNSPFSRVKLKTSPTKPSPPPLPTSNQCFLEESRRRPQSWSALSLRQMTRPNNYLVDRSNLPAAATTTATTTIANTLGLAGSVVKSSAVGSRLLSFPNNSLPPESLHCPPIIDAPWEELDGSEGESLPLLTPPHPSLILLLQS
ncbi:unnamed protein product [Schistocephalus solidus]|uniref:Uncharacterized protein n=1 Tax=Schistocephalus solidus TaxID=70667 RepID=A0A183TJB9_SCHSO|nr:unnamed protein product [Schistocephalus solidus]